MISFMKFLNEMPYIEVNHKPFDIEIEKYSKNPKGFVKLIQDIFDGKNVEDKYGDQIQLKTLTDKKQFISQLRSDMMFTEMIKKWKIEKEISNIFKGL